MKEEQPKIKKEYRPRSFHEAFYSQGKIYFTKFEKKFFTLFLKMHAISEAKYTTVAKLAAFIHFSILVLTFVEFEGYWGGGRIQGLDIINYFAKSIVVGLNLGMVSMYAWFYSTKQRLFGKNHSPIRMIIFEVFTLLVLIYPFVGAPFTLYMFSEISTKLNFEYWLYSLPMMIIALILATMSLLFSRNCFPTQNLLSTIEPISEYTYFMVIYGLQIMKLLFDEYLWMDYLSTVVLLLCWSYLITNRVYWDLDFNQFYIGWFSILIGLVMTISLGNLLPFVQKFNYALPLLICNLSYKYSTLALEDWAYINFLEEDISVKKLTYALIIYDKLAGMYYDEFSGIKYQEKKLYLHYEGIIQYHKFSCKDIDCWCKRTETLERKRVLLFLILQAYRKNPKYLGLLIKIQLNETYFNMTTFRPYLIMHQKKVSGIISRFEFFHIMSIYEVILSSVAYEKNKKRNYVSDSLKHLYRDIYVTAGREVGEDSLNIGVILDLKNKYISLVELISDILKTLESKFEKLKKNEGRKAVEYHRFNKIIFEINEQLRRKVNKIFHVYKDVIPSYFYSLLMMYYSNVRNEAKLAQEYYKTYKFKLSNWKSLYETSEDLKADNLMINCTLFRVSLEKKTRGIILDYSPDFYNYLGERLPKCPKGTNINDLFPDIFQTLHYEKMANISGFHLLMNIKRFFFLKGYDGFLRQIIFIVKVQHTISNDISAFTYIRTRNLNNKCKILVDSKYDIFLGTKTFWDIMDHNKVALQEVSNLKDISLQLANDIMLLQKLKGEVDKHMKTFANLNENDACTKIRSFFSKMSQGDSIEIQIDPKSIKKYAEQKGLAIDPEIVQKEKTYIISEESPLFSLMGDSKFTATITTFKFYTFVYYEIFLEFDRQYYPEDEMDVSESKGYMNSSERTENDNKSMQFRKSIMRSSQLGPEEAEGLKLLGNSISKTLNVIDKMHMQVDEFPFGRSLKETEELNRATGRNRVESALTQRLKHKKVVTFLSHRDRTDNTPHFPDLEVNGGGGFTERATKNLNRMRDLANQKISGPMRFINRVNFQALAENRERMRRIQRSKRKISVLLASSKFITAVLKSLKEKNAEKANISKVRAQEEAENEMNNGSVATFYKINMNMLIDRALRHPRNDNLFYGLNAVLFYYIINFLICMIWFSLQIRPVTQSQIILGRTNEQIILSSGTSRVILMSVLEGCAFSIVNDTLAFKDVTQGLSYKDFIRTPAEYRIANLTEMLKELMTTERDEVHVSKYMEESFINFYLRDVYKMNYIDFEGKDSVFEANFFFAEKEFLSNSIVLLGTNISKSTSDNDAFNRDVFEYYMMNFPNNYLLGFQNYIYEIKDRTFPSLQKNYLKNLYIYLCYYFATLLISFLSFMFVIYLYNQRFNGVISTYSQLKMPEVEFQLRLLRMQTSLLSHHKFHEEKILIDYRANNKTVIEIKHKLKEQLKKTGKMYNTSSLLKEINSGIFPSITKVIGTSILVMIFFLVFIIYLYNFNSFIKQVGDMIKLEIEVGNEYIKHNNLILMLEMNVMFGTRYKLMNMDVSSSFFQANNRTINYIDAYSSSREEISNLVGSAYYNKIDALMREDQCGEIQTNYGPLGEAVCGFFGGIGKSGIVKYFYFEDEYIKKLQEIVNLRRSEGAGYSISDPQFDDVTLNEYFTIREFLQIRLSHVVFAGYYADRLLVILREATQSLINGTGYYIDNFIFIFSILAFAVNILQSIFSSQFIKVDFRYCLETFRIIHPNVLINNAYLLNSFKRYFDSSIVRIN